MRRPKSNATAGGGIFTSSEAMATTFGHYVRDERRAKGRKAAFGTLDGGVRPRSLRRWAGRGRLFRPSLSARLTGHAFWRVELLGYDKAPNGQLVDVQPSDPDATDCQSTDGKCTDGHCADCDCAQRKPADRKRPGCDRSQGSWGSAHRFHASQGVA